MNLPTAYTPSRHVRKIRYIDETLQKLLLIGLVLLEAALAAGLAWMMYQHLNQIIEDNLYRVHLADDVPMLTQLMHEEFILLGLFFAVNLIALLTVDLFCAVTSMAFWSVSWASWAKLPDLISPLIRPSPTTTRYLIWPKLSDTVTEPGSPRSVH